MQIWKNCQDISSNPEKGLYVEMKQCCQTNMLAMKLSSLASYST